MNGANESYEDFKSFISQKLKEQRRDIVLELEKCKEDENIWDYIYALKKQI
jgi:AAA+ ATPase superfamily predicted ATPase